jgi:hypothetical protein
MLGIFDGAAHASGQSPDVPTLKTSRVCRPVAVRERKHMVNVVMVLLSLVLPLVHLPIIKGPWRIGNSNGMCASPRRSGP